MKPRSRDDVLVEHVDNEVVVYDEASSEAHRLNPTAAFVWRMADGRRSVSEIAADLRRTFTEADGPESEDLVRLALDSLRRANLLQGAGDPLGAVVSRRHMLRLAATLLPVVATITVQEPLYAVTPTPTPEPTPEPTPTSTPVPPDAELEAIVVPTTSSGMDTVCRNTGFRVVGLSFTPHLVGIPVTLTVTHSDTNLGPQTFNAVSDATGFAVFPPITFGEIAPAAGTTMTFTFTTGGRTVTKTFTVVECPS